jgi:AmmeMemoRadiSam system protein B
MALLPALRRTLDVMPSPLPERPGLLLRDPFRYTEKMVILPGPVVQLLALFDGRHDELDLRAALVRMTGELEIEEFARGLVEALSTGGFLEDEAFEEMKAARHREFASAARREAVHAGGAYPAEREPLVETLRGYLADGQAPGAAAAVVAQEAAAADGLVGIAAPHVSPEGGVASYRAAYVALGADQGERTFVILGTSHYGEPERFGLTRKPYASPLGTVRVDDSVVDRLEREGGAAVHMDDYCHAVEHSIEFQVVFLQHLYGPKIRIVPVLCGPFAKGTIGGRPEDDEGVRRFLGVLGDVAASEGSKLCWVLGVDMAHIGRRYGDTFRARAGEGPMALVEVRDRARIERIAAADASGFWELVQENGDDLRWCGASPLYTFLRAVAPRSGRLLHYEQWNIDADSVVSFAGLAFA